MKNFLYRAKSLILIFLMVSMLISLFFVALEKREMKKVTFPYMSKHAVVGNMNQSDIFNKKLSKVEFAKEIISLSTEYYYSAELDGINSYALFFSENMLPKINISSGRMFSQADFLNTRNVAISSSKNLEKCIEKDGIHYFLYEGRKYQIIGIYDDVDKYGNEYPEVILNYLASNLSDKILNCNYLYDSGVMTEQNMEKLMEKISQTYEGVYTEFYSVSSKGSQEYIKDNSNIKSMILMVSGLALLVLLNAISACRYWIQGRKKEIAVRRLVGAKKTDILRWILMDFVKLTSCAFIMGIMMTKLFLMITPYLPVAESTTLMFGNNISYKALFTGYSTMIILGICVVLINLYGYNKSEIVRNIR